MKIYLAARYGRHREMQEVRADLAEGGHCVTSRWIDGGHDIGAEGLSGEMWARFAMEDLLDVVLADMVISFTEDPCSTNGRGGRHVEFGMAYALEKRVAIVGPRENAFHWLPRVEWYPNYHGFLVAFIGRGSVENR